MKCVMGLCAGLALCASVAVVPANAIELAGATSVEVTSDTAAQAKNMALAQARRTIVNDAVLPFADKAQLTELIANTEDGTLTDFVVKTGIGGERFSDTTYFATVSMVLDTPAVKRWLTDNNVENWLDMDVDKNQVLVVVMLSSPLSNWIDFKQILRDRGITFDTVRMQDKQVVITIPYGDKEELESAMGGAGWHVRNLDGTLQIWQ